ncbi:MAG: hypothetical protein ACRDSN_04800, partial [Pseudonocardiaceae bacterium]
FTTGSAGELIVSTVGLLFHLALVLICLAKGRLLHGTVGFLFSPLAIYGAIRLGKPGSAWARRFYGERNPEKQRRAEERFRPDRRTEREKERFRDAVGGTTTEEYEAKLAERAVAAEAASDMRARAERVTANEARSAGAEPVDRKPA